MFWSWHVAIFELHKYANLTIFLVNVILISIFYLFDAGIASVIFGYKCRKYKYQLQRNALYLVQNLPENVYIGLLS